jgi:hypothetical protein
MKRAIRSGRLQRPIPVNWRPRFRRGVSSTEFLCFLASVLGKRATVGYFNRLCARNVAIINRFLVMPDRSKCVVSRLLRASTTKIPVELYALVRQGMRPPILRGDRVALKLAREPDICGRTALTFYCERPGLKYFRKDIESPGR